MEDQSETDFSLSFRKKPSDRDPLDSAADTTLPRAAGEPRYTPGLPLTPLVYRAGDWHYDMSGDKLMVIFNHYQYKKSRYFRKQPTTRRGTARDVERLRSVFMALGFQVTVYDDLDHDDILDVMAKMSKRDHRGTSCVCVTVLSHGERGGEVLAADRPYELRDLLAPLQHGAAGLVGKPKLLLVQACRGDRLDAGQVQLDGAGGHAVIGTHADTFIFTSSVEDYVSWRDANGSWLIQEFCRVVESTHRDLDLLQMATLVTGLVTRERASNTPSVPDHHDKKQTPETRSTLTKFLRFLPPHALV